MSHTHKIAAFFHKRSVRTTGRLFKTAMKGILTIFLIGAITASIVGSVLVVYVVATFDGKEGLPDLSNINLNQSSIIYVKNENGDYEEFQHVQGANSVWTDLENIPLNMQNAVIAIEDKRFYQHKGVDWQRTVAATANSLFHFRSTFGGSTITQQLIKNLTKDDEQRADRKIREIFRALEMEANYATKTEILEAYLNILPLSGNVEGVGAAANYYFAKDVKNLSLAECAVIASITQNPSLYNPYTHPDNVKQRQHVVLYSMYEQGLITEDEYIQAYNEELVFKSSMRRVGQQDYYTDYLTEQVINDLVDTFGYKREYATQMFYYGGLKIYSAENPTLQAKVEAIFADEKNNFPKPIKTDKEDPQAGIAILDYTGKLVATVGGRGEKQGNRVLNRATDSTRQPGSSIKPLSVYAQAVELNLINYSTIMQDKKITLRNGDQWPFNYSRNVNYGSLPIEEAVQRSLNTIPAQLMEQITPQRSFNFMTENFHLSTLVKSAVVNNQVKTDIDFAPLTLGGLTYGVKVIDMAAAYQTFGNGGIYNEPYSYYEVKRGDEVLLSREPSQFRALSEDTAYVMNRLLQRVVNGPYGTAKGLQIGSFETFGKTGTTNDDKDVYFSGGTPYYVGACWFGYDDNTKLKVTTYAKSLWKKSMLALHEGLPAKTFTKKGSTVEARYCRETGLLATDKCPRTEVGVYRADNVPGVCTKHGGAALATGTTSSGTTSATSAASSGASTSQTASGTSATSSATSSAATTTTTKAAG